MHTNTPTSIQLTDYLYTHSGFVFVEVQEENETLQEAFERITGMFEFENRGYSLLKRHRGCRLNEF